MEKINLVPSSQFDFSQAERLIETSIEKIGLSISLRGTIKGYPGSIHWHVIKDKEKGTLEITVIPEQRQIWCSIHTNRQGAWIAQKLEEFQNQVASILMLCTK